MAFATTDIGAISSLSKRTWLFLVLSGLATGLSWACYFRALQMGEASRVAPVDKLSVVFAILLAGIFLHERLTWHHWIGGTLIAGGAEGDLRGEGDPRSRGLVGCIRHDLDLGRLTAGRCWVHNDATDAL